MEMVGKVTRGIRQLTEVGLALVMLGVVFQVLFGASLVFLPVDITANVIGFVKALGSEGLVGLIALWILYGIYNKNSF
ncbi:MAG: hypothetical protein VX699_13195 [Myxococcota bacterium]|nr:hypothetical protein [Myxococcota bacterium]|tara:strand:+ start:341 stop:574 length:234 start_codon:yes stop_codon:yes gene_type:complete